MTRIEKYANMLDNRKGHMYSEMNATREDRAYELEDLQLSITTMADVISCYDEALADAAGTDQPSLYYREAADLVGLAVADVESCADVDSLGFIYISPLPFAHHNLAAISPALHCGIVPAEVVRAADALVALTKASDYYLD